MKIENEAKRIRRLNDTFVASHQVILISFKNFYYEREASDVQ